MKLFIANRAKCGLDQIQNIVILAESLAEAKLTLADKASMNNRPSEYTFKEVDMSEAQIVLEDIKYG
jgi:hypothetical protein